jgi:7-carboxy-7-deazaguanine synthase
VLTVNEIFHSIQGESTHAGRPCVFVRLTACDLRCSWCDTPYAFHEGRKMSVDEVAGAVRAYRCDVVEITGGEPLLQKEVYPLMQRLLDDGRTVMLETGGHLSVDQVPGRSFASSTLSVRAAASRTGITGRTSIASGRPTK